MCSDRSSCHTAVTAARRLPAEEVGDQLLGLLDRLRSNVATALEAAARKDALASKVLLHPATHVLSQTSISGCHLCAHTQGHAHLGRGWCLSVAVPVFRDMQSRSRYWRGSWARLTGPPAGCAASAVPP